MIFFLALFGIAFASPMGDASGVEVARDYFMRLYEDRASIKSGEVVYTSEIERDERDPDFIGSVKTYRMWFDGELRRLDIDEVRPRDPSEAVNSRYAFSDGVHRLIDIDRPNVIVREYTQQFLAGQPAPLSPMSNGEWIDLRLLGVFGIDFGLLPHSRIEDLKAFSASSTLRARPANASTREPAEYEITKVSGSRSIYMTSGKFLLPYKMITHFAPKDPYGRSLPKIRIEVDCNVETFINRHGATFEFPRTLVFRRIVEGKATDIEKLTTISAEFNVSIGPELMTWKALRPHKGVLLEYNGESNGDRYSSIAWDGEKFRKTVDAPNHRRSVEAPSELQPDRSGRLRAWSYASATLAAIFVTIVIWSRYRQRNASLRSG